MSASPRNDLPLELLAWVETTTSGRVVDAVQHIAGASRSAWSIDVAGPSDRGARGLFLLRDKGTGGGSHRDAAVLRALAPTSVPVPEVVGASEEMASLLLERLPGRSDFPPEDAPDEVDPVARHLMEHTGELHALDVARLDIPHLAIPRRAEDCARGSLAQACAAATALGPAADPFFSFALDWLEANVPGHVDSYALVHSDMGPGNFLFENGRVTGIIDWEVAHFGDPMEDLAAIAVRDMATPIGPLEVRFDEYETSTRTAVDLNRVRYYRALVLVRNSLMIGLGLANPPKGYDIAEMTMYQTLLVRAAALALCENLGIDRPSVASAFAEGAVGDPLESERRDAARLLGLSHSQRNALRDAGSIANAVRSAMDRRTTSQDELARYFSRRMHRLAKRHESLLGALYERLPQPLARP